jgi:hypothetical protein
MIRVLPGEEMGQAMVVSGWEVKREQSIPTMTIMRWSF